MIEKLEKIKNDALRDIEKCNDEVSLNNIKSNYMGKKSVFNEIMIGMKDLTQEEKREVGSKSNEVRNDISKAIENRLASIKELELNKKDCKEMNKSINVLLIDIKTIKSAIFDYNVKISKIRKELNKNLTKGNNLNKEVEYLIKHYSKKK